MLQDLGFLFSSRLITAVQRLVRQFFQPLVFKGGAGISIRI